MSAKLKLWRCLSKQCLTAQGKGHEFSAAHPVCPACGTDGRLAENHDLIMGLETVHYDPPRDNHPWRGKGHAACDPKKSVLGDHAAAHPAAVTCPACKDTEAYREACERFDVEVPERQATPPCGE